MKIQNLLRTKSAFLYVRECRNLTITVLALLSTSVLIGLPLSSVSNEQRLKIQCRLPFSCCGAYTFRTVPRSPQSVLIFQSVSSFDDGIPDNKEKSQQRNQMKCISERAIDSHVELTNENDRNLSDDQVSQKFFLPIVRRVSVSRSLSALARMDDV
ncbi:hypothetical protein T4A_3114 [Trichinella pseudospiralis]|uniref:Uncharacterized protein n=1 Tax=Trichinella pseudospiralis TaxID=6337 RepID=A0A0V1DX68_TRIPS|nr:hypothetical protein T4A_3114 [Trichinella pseudospiralis]